MTSLVCDGCGRAASAEHIAARIARLEWATRYRPIHIQALFVKRAPGPSHEVDYSALLDALDIPGSGQHGEGDFLARLVEFQRRGFCLIHLTECPADGDESTTQKGSGETELSLCERMGPTLIRRIRFSYRPKHVVLLSEALGRLLPQLQGAGMGDLLLLDKGQPLELALPGGSAKQDGSPAWEQLKVYR